MVVFRVKLDIELWSSNNSTRCHFEIEGDLRVLHAFDPAPDGGAQAWLVVAGGGTVFFCCLGFTNTFGAFESYYLTHQLSDKTADEVAWIGSLAGFLMFAVGLIAGPLFDRIGHTIILPSAIAYIFSMMILSLCKTYWQTMLVHGLLLGILMGLLQIPVIAAIAHWFHKRRGLALGLVVAGSSIGGVIMPIAVSKMLNGTSLGFGWTVRIIGFIMMPLLGFSCITIKARIPPRRSSIWTPAIFKDVEFLILVASIFFAFAGLYTPIFYIPTYAEAIGMDATMSGYLLAILNAASSFGRVFPGIAADKFGRINIFAIACLATSLVIFCWDSAKSTAALVVYVIFFGFWSGTIISGASTVLSACTHDLQKIGTYMGWGLFMASFGTLIGPPINGIMISKYGNYFPSAMFSGAITALGGLLAVFAKSLTSEGLFGRI
ncbi:putative MFS monocarboxylate transporter [Truncatella angustata]|uniref:MFS monocarboxylate transporter n=1 Tax=Truncatella angustata TaxID=152316 RepID=A0A9P9A2Q1_9PEZI|nr:putative MFS monocarboxylate transporter [Truncatella angustata]KAH6658446.1 putative MFS monocarboxylate transporter [Truncatella angustata]